MLSSRRHVHELGSCEVILAAAAKIQGASLAGPGVSKGRKPSSDRALTIAIPSWVSLTVSKPNAVLLGTTLPMHPDVAHLERAISSMRRINLTVSAASSMALVLTSKGCNTFSSAMFVLTPPVLTLTPAFFSPRS